MLLDLWFLQSQKILIRQSKNPEYSSNEISEQHIFMAEQ